MGSPIPQFSNYNRDVREKWLRALHREDIEDLKNISVCSKHFAAQDLITEADMPQPDGSIQKIPRRPILCENAIPCLLPNCPKYLSTKHSPLSLKV